jgi:hypothetical protein
MRTSSDDPASTSTVPTTATVDPLYQAYQDALAHLYEVRDRRQHDFSSEADREVAEAIRQVQCAFGRVLIGRE